METRKDKNHKILNKKFKRVKIKKSKNISKNDKHEKRMQLKIRKNNILTPINFKYLKDLVNDAYTHLYIDNTFILFKSIDDLIYIIYSNNKKSIIAYNLIDNKKIIEIKNAHNENITNFRHYLDLEKKKNFILSISNEDNNIKLWDIYNFKCLLNIKKAYKESNILSACFLYDNNKIYIITCNCYNPIKIFKLNGHIEKEINDSNNEATFFIDVFYDNYISNQNYIIKGNKDNLKSYDYIENKVFNKYQYNEAKNHANAIIYNTNDGIEIIDSCRTGFILIWNFHSGVLLKKIYFPEFSHFDFCGIYLYNKEYLIACCSDTTIKIIELNTNKIINNLSKFTECIVNIKKIIQPKYGECLISQDIYNKIKLWIKNI